MRYIEELRSTTNNYVYNRLRIPYDSSCGYCGLGSRCNRARKNKWYHRSRRYKKQINISPEGYKYRVITDEFQYEGIYPNWKMVSKNKKQWMKKPLKTTPNEYHHPEYREKYPDNVEFIWRGNDRKKQY